LRSTTSCCALRKNSGLQRDSMAKLLCQRNDTEGGYRGGVFVVYANCTSF
jgi:hypothetical protein